MFKNVPTELLAKGLINQEQFNVIEPIVSGKIVSVFYELRTLLYLSVMLLATGLGMLIYENIGDSGHLFSIVALCLITLACFWYVFKQSVGYSNTKVKTVTPYFDYILLLGCLLVIAIQGYLQFQYGLLDNALGLSTLISAAFFFLIAYRYDHLGILSMAIAALASFWSISVSPQKWYSDEFFSSFADLYIVAIIFGATLTAVALALDFRDIKKHFTFTYVNFSSLIFFIGATTGLFVSDYYIIYVLIIFTGCALAFYFAKWKQSFLFLLYAFIFGYIGTTFLLSVSIFRYEPVLWFLYSMFSCGAFIYFIIKFKNYFSKK